MIKFTNPEHFEELAGVSEALGIDMLTPIIISYFTEIQAFCTSTVARLNNGTLIHLRNLDYDMVKEH